MTIFLISNISIATSINLTKKETDLTTNNTTFNTNTKIKEIIEKINKSIIEKFFLELMSIGPRMTSTHGCKEAGKYIYDRFSEFNLNTEKHRWAGFGNIWNPQFYRSENIIGTLEGENDNKEDTIIFNAHYDSVRDSLGANDDGSGVVGVLAAAYVLSQYSFNKTIKFVTFSGEEIGLVGSTHYVKKIYEENLDILVEFNADMIGRAITKEDGREIRLSYSEDTDWIIKIMEDINKTNDEFDLEITNRYPYDRDSKRGGSDYFPFIKYGYESISVWEKAGDPYANTPGDKIFNVNISYLVNTTRIIAATIATLADIIDQPPKITISTPKKGKIYNGDRILKTLKEDKTFVFDDMWIYTDINKYNSKIDKVEFYYDEKLECTREKLPYTWHLNKTSFGKHKITAKVYDDLGRNSTDQINIFYVNFLKSR